MKKIFIQCFVYGVLSGTLLSCSKDVKSPVNISAAKVKVTNTPAQYPSQTPSDNNHTGDCHNDNTHVGK